jgi:hypothetical protein
VYLDDSSVHEQMVRYATQAFEAGRLPLTHWFPYLSLGSPQFLHYQSLGAMLTGLAGTAVGPDQAFRWSLYLMVGLWPLAIYLSGRLFGISRGAAAAAAVLSPLVVSTTAIGYERGAYVWVGFGVWAQLWGSWALPFAWAATWRAMRDTRWLWLAAAVVALSTDLHFETGYLAFMGVVAVVFVAPGPFRHRLARAAVVFGAAMAAAAWVVVPLVLTSRWAAVNEVLAGTPFARGYGARQDLEWLVTGRVFDSGRFPVISLAVLAGGTLAARHWRRDPLGRFLLVLFVASLLASFGPAAWGPLANAVPGHADLFFRRFMMGAQLAGLYLAGAGVVAAAGVAAKPLASAWRWVTAGEGTTGSTRVFVLSSLCFAGPLLAWPALSQISSYDQGNAFAIAAQRAGEARDAPVISPLLAYIRRFGGGRTYAGMPNNWGADFHVGSVPVFKYLESQDVDEVGYTLRTASLMSGPEYHFDQADPSDYALFGIRYLLLPSGMPAPVPATRVMASGDYALWAISSDGYIDIVRVTGRMSADRADVGSRSLRLLQSNLISRHQDWLVQWPGGRAGGPLLSPLPGRRSPGSASDVHVDLGDGAVRARVDMRAAGAVMLSVSYDPGWQAWVDGHRAPTVMLAPAVVGVDVGRGAHRVVLEYRGQGWYPELAAFGLAGLLGAFWAGSRWRDGPGSAASDVWPC